MKHTIGSSDVFSTNLTLHWLITASTSIPKHHWCKHVETTTVSFSNFSKWSKWFILMREIFNLKRQMVGLSGLVWRHAVNRVVWVPRQGQGTACYPLLVRDVVLTLDHVRLRLAIRACFALPSNIFYWKVKLNCPIFFRCFSQVDCSWCTDECPNNSTANYYNHFRKW